MGNRGRDHRGFMVRQFYAGGNYCLCDGRQFGDSRAIRFINSLGAKEYRNRPRLIGWRGLDNNNRCYWFFSFLRFSKLVAILEIILEWK